MLRSLSDIIGYRLGAIDDDLGAVKDFYFDDLGWVVRYLVADTRAWLPGRRVLISPAALGEPRWIDRILPVGLTTEEIKNGPDISEEMPVSRQHEIMLADAFNWDRWWQTAVATPPRLPVMPLKMNGEPAIKEDETWDPNLRSFKEVKNYNISARDGSIGHVEDLVADTDTWIIRYLVVDTRNWLPAKKVLVAVGWLDGVSWQDRSVKVALSRDQVKGSPEFNPRQPVNREQEVRLYDFHGRPKYWEREHAL